MSDDFSGKMRPFFSRREHAKQEELANIRQWYYSVSEEERSKFKQDIQSLITASKPFNRSDFTLVMNFTWTWHSEDESITLSAARTPVEILKATGEWDKADEKEWGLPRVG